MSYSYYQNQKKRNKVENFIQETIKSNKNQNIFGKENKQKIMENIRCNIRNLEDQTVHDIQLKYKSEIIQKQQMISKRIPKHLTDVRYSKVMTGTDYFQKFEQYQEETTRAKDDKFNFVQMRSSQYRGQYQEMYQRKRMAQSAQVDKNDNSKKKNIKKFNQTHLYEELKEMQERRLVSSKSFRSKEQMNYLKLSEKNISLKKLIYEYTDNRIDGDQKEYQKLKEEFDRVKQQFQEKKRVIDNLEHDKNSLKLMKNQRYSDLLINKAQHLEYKNLNKQLDSQIIEYAVQLNHNKNIMQLQLKKVKQIFSKQSKDKKNIQQQLSQEKVNKETFNNLASGIGNFKKTQSKIINNEKNDQSDQNQQLIDDDQILEVEIASRYQSILDSFKINQLDPKSLLEKIEEMRNQKEEMIKDIEKLRIIKDQKKYSTQEFTNEYSRFNDMDLFQIQQEIFKETQNIKRENNKIQKNIDELNQIHIKIFKIAQNIKNKLKQIFKTNQSNDFKKIEQIKQKDELIQRMVNFVNKITSKNEK